MGNNLIQVIHGSEEFHSFENVGSLERVLEGDSEVLARGLHGYKMSASCRKKLPWFGRGGCLEYLVLPISIKICGSLYLLFMKFNMESYRNFIKNSKIYIILIYKVSI